jgi:DNA-directed RNA polymerase specialized sigma24 family protein
MSAPPSNHSRWTQDEDAVIRRFAHSMTAEEIGARLNRTKKAVHIRAQKLGVSLQKYGEHAYQAKYSDELVERCRVLHDEGRRPSEIAAATGVNVFSVHKIVYYGMRLRPTARCAA